MTRAGMGLLRELLDASMEYRAAWAAVQDDRATGSHSDFAIERLRLGRLKLVKAQDAARSFLKENESLAAQPSEQSAGSPEGLGGGEES